MTLLAVSIYAAWTIVQLRSLRALQTQTIDRNRTDSLLLLRIQNGLNALGLTMRDMLDNREPYPLTAWRPQFRRIRTDLEDALAREEALSPVDHTDSQRRYLADSFRQFWDALDRILDLAAAGNEAEARTRIQVSLQARQAALTSGVARALVRNNESEQLAATRTQEIYAGVERNVYIFLAAMLIVIVLTSLYLVQYNRRLFDQVAGLSERRSELARQLITMQENTFRSISRELHDDFGQILTAIGAMLRRPDDLQEVHEIVQTTLEKVRTLSHALHPVVLDEIGLEGALESYLPNFERQTGIEVLYERRGQSGELDGETATHLYRIVQEALNNVTRHSNADHVAVRLQFMPDSVTLEIEDNGRGFMRGQKRGLGQVSMRERAELMKGRVEFSNSELGGARVKVYVGQTL